MNTAADGYARMLNAGFCAVLTVSLLKDTTNNEIGYGPGLPWVTPYILLPFALHKSTAELLSSSRARGLQEFLHSHSRALAGYEHRVRILVPFVRAGLACAVRRGVLTLDRSTRRLVPRDPIVDSRVRIREVLTEEGLTSVVASRKLGRWANAITLAYLCDLVCCRPTLGKEGSREAISAIDSY